MSEINLESLIQNYFDESMDEIVHSSEEINLISNSFFVNK
jgi:hypothetical protein